MSIETVMKKFPTAQTHKRITDGVVEIWADGSAFPLPHVLGEGATIEKAWADAAQNIADDEAFWSTNAPLSYMGKI